MDFLKLIKDFQICDCGAKHECNLKDVRVGSGIISKTGEILLSNGFKKNLLLVADKNTLKASSGIEDYLSSFNLTKLVYENLRVATMPEVEKIEKLVEDNNIDGILSVGSGSLNDICRLSSYRKNVPLCIFATAPSMDGFASDTAPIVDNCFKVSYTAKTPEVIVADTKILAKAPKELKSAGFGDMIAKYVALIDWKVSNIISSEPYCERVAKLTRDAVDSLVKLADKVTVEDEECAGKIFESLLLTGIAMSFTKNSRPASGTEHVMAHYLDCKELLENKIPNFHGDDVGVCTLIMLKLYNYLLTVDKISCHKENTDWDKVRAVYGELSEDMMKLNTPDTITDSIDPKLLEEKFNEIKQIIRSVPNYYEVYEYMKKAGCKLDFKQTGKSKEFIRECFIYHPYMRRRLSLKRLLNMTDFDVNSFDYEN